MSGSGYSSKLKGTEIGTDRFLGFGIGIASQESKPENIGSGCVPGIISITLIFKKNYKYTL